MIIFWSSVLHSVQLLITCPNHHGKKDNIKDHAPPYMCMYSTFTVNPDVLLMGTLQTSAGTLVFWLAVWVEQVAACASKLLSSFGTWWQELVEIFQNFQVLIQYFEDKFVLEF